MELTVAQREFVMSKQRNAVVRNYAEVAKKIVERYPNKERVDIKPEDLSDLILISNIGESHPEMIINGISIYSEEYGSWSEEGGIAQSLNAIKGLKSIEMASEQGIELSEEMTSAIDGSSINIFSMMMKVAQTYEAIKHSRLSRGIRKEAVKSLSEMEEILRDEIERMMSSSSELTEELKSQLTNELIESAIAVYSIEDITLHMSEIIRQKDSELRDLGLLADGDDTTGISQSYWTSDNIEGFLRTLTNEQLIQLKDEISDIYDENSLGKIISRYGTNNKNLSQLIIEVTDEIEPMQMFDLMDELNLKDNTKDL